jgi:hypothetical protein
VLEIEGGKQVPICDLLLTEASADLLFQNPEALHGFGALLHDDAMQLRKSLWPVANEKLKIYRENRRIVLDALQEELGAYPESFRWTHPEAGFFTVFTFLNPNVTPMMRSSRGSCRNTAGRDPMYDPADARSVPRAGLDQLRLSFCFSESVALSAAPICAKRWPRSRMRRVESGVAKS